MTDLYLHGFKVIDRSPEFRECCAARREGDLRHMDACPECLEYEARMTLFDATSHRADGNEAIALELEAEAAELRSRAANIRSNLKKKHGRAMWAFRPTPAEVA